MTATNVQLFVVDTTYDGVSEYHSGLVYRPAERVFVLPTMWIGSLDSPGTGMLYAKTLQAFLNYLEPTIYDRDNLAEILTNFEKFVTRRHIEQWVSARVIKRVQSGKSSPQDDTIEKDAHVVGRYLTWVKERLEGQGRGPEIPYEKNKTIRKISQLRSSDMLKGIVEKREIESVERVFRTSYNPGETPSKVAIARRKQEYGHEYLQDNEVAEFVNAFHDPVWKFVSLTSYHTGMRPFEILAIPRYEQYGGGAYFTCEPAQLRKLLDMGHGTINYRCVGKGRKSRLVTFNTECWLAIMSAYEELYQVRRKLWESKHKQELPLHYLWLNRAGEVRYCPPGNELLISQRTKPLHGAVETARKAHDLDRRFGRRVDFYSLRHSFATNYIVRAIDAVESLRAAGEQDVMNLIKDDSLRKRLSDQLGHSLTETTWRHYIHAAVARAGMLLPEVTQILSAKV